MEKMGKGRKGGDEHEKGDDRIGDWDGKGMGRETDEVICGCLAVSYEACARLAYAYAWASEILAQPLVVLEEAA